MSPDMKAIEITQPGGPEVLSLTQRPVPQPGPGEVLIKVTAAGVNRPDALQRTGAYRAPPDASDLPGLEAAGEVVARGPGVGYPALGDRVAALLPGGGYAEYTLAPASHCLPVPDGMAMIEAAAMPETLFTVWSNVFDRAALQPGERFLVHGGTSGIGTTAIQMASRLGARVFATAGTDAKCNVCRQLGAELAVNYREADFVAAVGAEGGADVILDMVGGDYLPRNIKALADDGRLVQIAFLAGAKADVNFAQVMLRRLTITGSTLRPQPVDAKTRIRDALADRVWPLVTAGKIAPVIDSTFPLEDAARAHARIEDPDHIGKIMLLVAPEAN
ncbi:MAG: NAD(P)H-quinone oxidoreductase [Pseudomonadota bacterium]